MGLLALLVCLAAVAFALCAFFLEVGDHRKNYLASYCKDVRDRSLQACQTQDGELDLVRCVDAIAGLERIEASATIWRTEVVVSFLLAIIVASAALCGASAAVLFLLSMLASIAFSRYSRSWEDAHIRAHTCETRRQLLRAMQGLPDLRSTFYT